MNMPLLQAMHKAKVMNMPLLQAMHKAKVMNMPLLQAMPKAKVMNKVRTTIRKPIKKYFYNNRDQVKDD